jgi:hypothetical protein
LSVDEPKINPSQEIQRNPKQVAVDAAEGRMTITDMALISGIKLGLPLKQTVAEQPNGRERRAAERAIVYWEDKVDAHGPNATVAVLDLAAIDSTDWSNRFIVAVDQRIERSTLLLYGSKFAGLLDLPPKARLDLPLIRQLPKDLAALFLLGCADAQMQMAPVRLAHLIRGMAGIRWRVSPRALILFIDWVSRPSCPPDHSEPHPPCLTIQSTRSAFQP